MAKRKSSDNKNVKENKAFSLSQIFNLDELTSDIKYQDSHDYFSAHLLEYIQKFPFEEYKVYLVTEEGRFFIDFKGDLIKNCLRQGDSWELHIKELLEKCTKPGSAVIDVGAHIGIHSMRMAKLVGPQGKVYSFEPQPKIMRELLMNRLQNGHKNIHIFPVALGNNNGTIELSPLLAGNEGGTSIGSGKSGYFAPIRTLDFFQFSNISLIKVDVEWMEDAFLEGAKNTIIRNKPVILIEIMGGHHYANASEEIRAKIDNTIGFLESLGYKVENILGCDYLALP